MEIKIAFDGHELNVVILGDEGKPFLYVLPGGPGLSSELYIKSMAAFSEQACLVFIDPPACGKSTGYSPESLTMEQYVRAVEATRVHLGHKKIQIIGTSYGAMVAFKYMVTHPANVSRGITVAGATCYRFIEMARKNLMERGTAEQIAVCDEFLWKGRFRTQDDMRRFFAVMGPLYSITTSPGTASPYQVEFNLDAVNMAWATDFWRFDVESMLPVIDFPLLCIWGNKDWVNDPSYSSVVKSKVPHAQIVLLDSGHSVSKDQPDAYREIVRRFLSPEAHYSVAMGGAGKKRGSDGASISP